MSKKIGRAFWDGRALLTETLPYELPIIFSNEKLYFSRCRVFRTEIAALYDKIFCRPAKYTIPYNYSINKDSRRQTTLSLIHPSMQIEFSKFYVEHESSLLTHCTRSNYSLRHPNAVAAIYSASKQHQDEPALKTGLVDLVSSGHVPDTSKIVSYFAYEKYNLLAKFHESREFISLEKRFSKLRQIDITKCFYSIYTHSIAWATRSKEFAKENVNSYYFEGEFDSLMQRSNYNETHGIVVGPEISRIFAEIILQSIDKKVREVLFSREYIDEKNYAIRRYVDDYSLFSNDTKLIDEIEEVIRHELAEFKLYINESKIRDFERPFISNITQARNELLNLIHALRALVGSEEFSRGDPVSRYGHHLMGSLLSDFRAIVKRHSIDVNNVSGATLGGLRSIAKKSNSTLKKQGAPYLENWIKTTRTILDFAFYVTAVDLRVRSSYSLCQVLILITSTEIPDQSSRDAIFQLVMSKLIELAEIISQNREPGERGDCIELFNILICGSHIFRESFVSAAPISKILDSMIREDLTYFKYITIKYCLLSDAAKFSSGLNLLNKSATEMLELYESIATNSECFHLFCDHLSAPDIDASERLRLFKRFLGGNPAKADIVELCKYIGFADWSGLSIEHTLKRRQLRPVYAVA